MATTVDYEIQQIPLVRLYRPSEWNCRKVISDEAIASLMQTMAADGLQIPVVVQPAEDVDDFVPDDCDWRLIAGYRRAEAAIKLGWEYIPAFVKRDLTEDQARHLNFLENIEREDLTVAEQVQAIQRMFEGKKATEIAAALGKSQEWVRVRNLYATAAHPDVRREIDAGRLALRDLIVVCRRSPDEQMKYVERQRALSRPPKAGGKTAIRRALRSNRTVPEIREKNKELGRKLGEGPWNWVLAWAAGDLTDGALNSALDNWNE